MIIWLQLWLHCAGPPVLASGFVPSRLALDAFFFSTRAWPSKLFLESIKYKISPYIWGSARWAWPIVSNISPWARSGFWTIWFLKYLKSSWKIEMRWETRARVGTSRGGRRWAWGLQTRGVSYKREGAGLRPHCFCDVPLEIHIISRDQRVLIYLQEVSMRCFSIFFTA